ncbi:MAG: hypothetical protein ACXVCS_11595 [Bdellovibrionota bacterium]
MKSRVTILYAFLIMATPLGAQAKFGNDFDETDPPDSESAAPAAPATTPVTTDASFTPAPKKAAVPYQEKGPRDLKTYIDSHQTPNYIRIDVKAYHIRTSPDFAIKRTDNIDFKTKGGETFAVEHVKAGQYGAAVQIHVDDDLRWIYVPYDRKNDFQFCESEACFSAMARSLDYLLKGSSVSVQQAQDCGVVAGPEGLILPKGAVHPGAEPDLFTDAIDIPSKHDTGAAKPKPAVKPAPPSQAITTSASMRTRPLWEVAKGSTGSNWTRMLSDSIDKYGQGLLKQKSLSDARTFCPNFGKPGFTDQDKKEFWIHLFSGIASRESGFKLGAPAFDESRHVDVFHGPINAKNDSMGLFALSYGSAAYGAGCSRLDINKDRHKDISDMSLTIYDPKIQMDCAVTVMSHWVPHDGGVGLSDSRGGARFWSTLRSSNPATKSVINALHRDTACFK